MPSPRFTREELATFESRLEATPGWIAWQRRSGAHGEDVLQVTVDGDPRATLDVAKAKAGYVATGFDGWALTVCDDFKELLIILAAWRPRHRIAELAA